MNMLVVLHNTYCAFFYPPNIRPVCKNDQLSSGLATTHEQVSDSYMEGEITAPYNSTNEKKAESSNEGYQDYYS